MYKRQVEEFVRTHPNWIIARSSGEAEKALAQGKRVLVLSLESAAYVVEKEEDLVEFIDQRGIRIVNLLHLTDDEFGGVAFLGGAKNLSSPFAALGNLFSGNRGEGGVRANGRGLTDVGRAMAHSLIDRGVWLDLAHASDAAQTELLPMLEKAGHVPLYTHTVLRTHHPAERAVSDTQLGHVKRLGGIVGLMPSEDMLKGTSVASEFCPAEQCPSGCQGGAHALATQYRDLASRIGAESIALGSDYNGGIPHLRPSCGTGTALDQQGMWNIGQASEVWAAMIKLGAPVPPQGKRVAQFLEAWKKITPQKKSQTE